MRNVVSQRLVEDNADVDKDWYAMVTMEAAFGQYWYLITTAVKETHCKSSENSCYSLDDWQRLFTKFGLVFRLYWHTLVDVLWEPHLVNICKLQVMHSNKRWRKSLLAAYVSRICPFDDEAGHKTVCSIMFGKIFYASKFFFVHLNQSLFI